MFFYQKWAKELLEKGLSEEEICRKCSCNYEDIYDYDKMDKYNFFKEHPRKFKAQYGQEEYDRMKEECDEW